jgi:hypothetical protein
MFFLLRMAFWLGVVLVLLPTGGAQRGPTGNEVNASEAISAASATVHDLKGFCGREPTACAVGEHAYAGRPRTGLARPPGQEGDLAAATNRALPDLAP